MSDTQVAAALAEEVYRRGGADQPLSLANINAKFGTSLQGSDLVTTAALNIAGVAMQQGSEGFVYSIVNSGFVAQVLQDVDGNITIVFRGTDWGPDGIVPYSGVESGDRNTDLALGFGSATNTQIKEAIALTKAAIDRAQLDGTTVTVVGQSLGGGLAGIVSAQLNVKSYLFDPAPFDNQIRVQAAEVVTDLPAYAAIKAAIPGAITDFYVKAAATQKSILLSSGLTSSAIDAYLAAVTSKTGEFEYNLGMNATAWRVAGEALSPGTINGLVDAIANPFPITVNSVSVGNGDKWALHGSALMALAVLSQPFDDLLLNDAALRDDIVGTNMTVSGPVSGRRADPESITYDGGSSPVTSGVAGDTPDPAILLRALWKDGGFLDEFVARFGDGMTYGLVFTGKTPTTLSQDTIHSSMVALGLEVVRDGLLPAGGVSMTARYVFDDVQADQNVGGMRDGYAIIHLGDIKSQTFQHAIDVLSGAFWTAAVAKSASFDVFSLIGPGDGVLQWDNVVVQSGTGAMEYAPVGADIDKRHLILAGDLGSDITTSRAGDYVLTGSGADVIHVGQGYAEGDGVGSVIIGSPSDTLDYSLSSSAVIVDPNHMIAASVDPNGVHRDLLIGFSDENIILPGGADLHNFVDLSHDVAGTTDHVTITGGHNQITASPTSSLYVGGTGGFNTLVFSQMFNTYTVSGSANDVVIYNQTTHVTYEAVDVQDFVFMDQYVTNVHLFDDQGYLWSWPDYVYSYPRPDHFPLGPVIHVAAPGQLWPDGGQATWDFNYHHATLSSSNTTITVDWQLANNVLPLVDGFSTPTSTGYSFDIEHFGEIPRAGSLSLSSQIPDPVYDLSGQPTGLNRGTNAYFVYTVDPTLLLSAPKHQFMDRFTITGHDDAGHSKTVDADFVVEGLGDTTTIVPGAKITLNLAPTPQPTQTASATLAFADSDLLDHHTATITHLGQGSQIGVLTATIAQDSTGSGSGTVMLNYQIDAAAVQALGTTKVEEYFQITLDDGLGGIATYVVPVTIKPFGTNAAPVAAPFQVSASLAGTSVLVVDPLSHVTDQDANDDLSLVAGSGTVTSSDGHIVAFTTQAGSIAIDSAQFAYLGAGEHLDLAIGYDATDGTATVHGTGTLTANGANDAPVVSAFSAGSASQSDAPVVVASLLSHASDPDLHDVLSLVAGSEIVTASDGHTVAFSVVDGAVTIDPAQFSYLGAGQHVDLAIGYDVTDGLATTHGTETLVVNGANDAPTIPSADQSQTASLSETPGSTGSATHTQTGTIHFADADATDRPASSIAAVSAVYTDAAGVVATLTSAQIASLEAGFAIADASGNTNAGSSAWTYAVADNALDFLGQGETIVLTANVTVDDHSGANATTPVTVTITGSNDAPQIAVADKATLTNDAEASGVTGSPAVHHLSGTVHFSDADLSDRPDGAATGSSAVYTDAYGVVRSLSSAQVTAFNAGFAVTSAPGNANSGQLTWDYSLSDGALDFLGSGETLAATFTVGVADQHGGVATADVALVFSGQNDAPAVSAIVSAPTTDRSGPVTVNLLAAASDADLHDVLSVVPGSVVLTSSDGHAVSGTVSGSLLTINPAQFQYLGAGQSVTLSYAYNVTDGTAVVANTGSQQIAHAVNHAPTVSAISAGTSTQNDAVKQINLLAGASDADASDTVAVAASSLVLSASDHHAVSGTLAGGVLSIDPSQFRYLHAGQSDTITAAYNVTDGTAVAADTATWVVTGLNDAPIVPSPDFGTTTQAANLVFNPLVGVINPDGTGNSLVAGSASATSSDGHVVSATIGGSFITLDASQFKYLADGQTAKVSIGFDVANSLPGAPTGHGVATVVVVGTNDAPVTPTSVTISNADTSAYDVFPVRSGTASTTDLDAGTVLGYAGYGGLLTTASYGYYAVNALGEYSYFADSAKINMYKTGTLSDTVTIVASDRSGGTGNISTIFSYTTTDDAPYNVSWASAGSVVEHSANGFDLGTLKAVDPDSGDTATWSMVDSAGGRFALSASGHVTVANGTLLDYATAPAGYDIIVKDTDASGLYVQQSVHVTLVQMPTATLSGTSGIDTLTGTAGNDVILGLAGNDTINAGAGDDLVLPGLGSNHSDGGTGINTVSYIDSTSAVTANLATGSVTRSGFAADTATNFQNVVGTPYDDVLYGTSGSNNIQGGAGNDQIYGRGGNDVIDGGPGTDTISFDDATSAITANLQTQTLGGAAAGTTISNIEGVVGGSGNDALTGFTSQDSYLSGGAGNDVLIGGTGNDTIIGGAGHDVIYGSLGADTVTDLDDAVFDYSGSPAGLLLYYSGGPGYLGYGGFAQGDTILTGNDSNQSGGTHYEFDLTPYNDVIKLGSWSTINVYGGAGDDTIIGDDVQVSSTYRSVYNIFGGDGFDTIHPGLDGYDTIDFGTGGGVLDYSVAGAGLGYASVVFSWAEPGGTSTVHVYDTPSVGTTVDAGVSTVVGDFGTFVGTPRGDTITGNSQANIIDGGGGYDTINGNAGDDYITAFSGVVHGGDGNDTILLNTRTGQASALHGAIYGDAGNDAITMTVNGATNMDIYGGDGNDTIDAFAGGSNTVIHGGAGADVLMGTSLVTVSYADASGAIAVNGVNGTAGDAMGDLIVGRPGSGNPIIVGSNYGDTFTSTANELHLGTGNNTVTNNTGVVYGNTGNDTITGSGVMDYIHSGGGFDFVTGGGGNDQIYFDHPAGVPSAAQASYAYGDGLDTIDGFVQGMDSFNFARIAGKADPVVSISQVNGNTDVHLTWYDTTPVPGQPVPAHVDADIMLHAVLLTTFNLGTDYHLV